MRYIVKFLAVAICMLPLAAYGFGSAEDVRIAKNGPATELAVGKVTTTKEVVVDKKEVTVVHDKVLEARIAAIEKRLKSGIKSDEKIKALAKEAMTADFETKTKELESRIDKKFVEYDNDKAAEAEADKKAKAKEKSELNTWKTTQEEKTNNAVKTANAALDKAGNVWWTLAAVLIGLAFIYVIVCVIGVVLYKHRQHA